MPYYIRFGQLDNGYDSFGSNGTNSSGCPGKYIHWMYKYLGDCVYTPKEQASEYLGLASMIIWMMVSLPQIFKNFRNLDGLAGISFFLLFQWATGDVTNLIGSILTKQLKFQIYLAVYFVFTDGVLLLQYSAFKIKQRKGRLLTDTDPKDPSTTPRLILCLMGVFLCTQVISPISSHISSTGDTSSVVGVGGAGYLSRTLLSTKGDALDTNSLTRDKSLYFQPEPHSGRNRSFIQGKIIDTFVSADVSLGSPVFWHKEIDIIGYIIGIVSSIFYLGSRIAQIVKNVKHQSTEGLAFMTFFLAVLGNIAYGLQIIVHSLDEEFLLEKTPWLVGSLGVVGLDVTLMCQFYYYRKEGDLVEMRQKLINNEYIINSEVPTVISNGQHLPTDEETRHHIY